jgi:hypothetical protein
MTEQELADANRLIARPPEFNLSAVRLGLFVVSRLAERHRMRVQLRESPYGGTTAIVLIPRELISELADEPVPVPAAVGAPAERAAKPTPVAGSGETAGSTRSPHTVTTAATAPTTAPRDEPVVQRQTSTGLPVRNRQANLPTPLQDDAPPPAAEPGDRPRPPERVRSMIASYQAGTRRARAELPPPDNTHPPDTGDR